MFSDISKEKCHGFSFSWPPALSQISVLFRLSRNRIRAGRSCKCAAGGTSIKLSAGRKQAGVWKNSTALGAMGLSLPCTMSGCLREHDRLPLTPRTETERERPAYLSSDPAQLAWCQSESSPGSACSDCRTSWCDPEKIQVTFLFLIIQSLTKQTNVTVHE